MLSQRIETAQLRELAVRGAQDVLRLAAGDMPRLCELLVPDAEFALDLDVGFATDHESRPLLRLRLSGSVTLVCQRCLGPLNWPVAISSVLTVVDSEQAAAALDDPFDSLVLTGTSISLAAAAEDELLASLPLAPMHEAEQACEVKGFDGSQSPKPASRANRPFAALGSLMAGRPDNGKDQEH